MSQGKIVRVKAYTPQEAKRKARVLNPNWTPKMARWDKPSLKEYSVMMKPRKRRNNDI